MLCKRLPSLSTRIQNIRIEKFQSDLDEYYSNESSRQYLNWKRLFWLNRFMCVIASILNDLSSFLSLGQTIICYTILHVRITQPFEFDDNNNHQ